MTFVAPKRLKPFEELSYDTRRFARDTRVLPPGYAPPKDHIESSRCRCYLCHEPVTALGVAGMVDD